MKQRTLTGKQKAVFDYIEEFITTNQRGPYIKEICAHFGFSSSATAFKYLTAIKRAGLITQTGQPGGILLTANDDEVKVPVLGTIGSQGICWSDAARKFLTIC